MKQLNYLLFFLLSFALLSCQNQSADQKVETSPPEQATTLLPPAPTLQTADAAVMQKTPLTEYAKQFYATALWHYEAAVVINDLEKGKAYEGKWIKFNPDHTLLSGFYQEAGKPGSWAIDESTNILTIVEGEKQPVYSEWKVKTSSSSDGIMIWVGTKRFGLNNTQIKMLRYNVKPGSVGSEQ